MTFESLLISETALQVISELLMKKTLILHSFGEAPCVGFSKILMCQHYKNIFFFKFKESKFGP